MKLRQLRRTHADYDAELLQKHRDLFDGGHSFGKNVDKYLTKNGQEPLTVYQQRCAVAKDEYVNYCAPIGNFFASWLMTSKLVFKSDPEIVDEFYDEFKEDCDGDGTDYEHFIRHRFIDAMIDQVAYWRVEFPPVAPDSAQPEDRKEWAAAGLGRGVLVHVPAASVTNWSRDKDGFVWLVEYSAEVGLLEPEDEDETTTETWIVWRRDGEHKKYQIAYTKKTKPPADAVIPESPMDSNQGSIEGIPFVCLELPKELWLMNLIAAPQIANWRKRVGLSWAIDRTCYAMPVFNVKNRRKPPTMGAGYYLIQSVEETASYLSPPPESYTVVKDYLSDLKDEIHRVVQQMARGVDNNAAAVGRSGDSKQADDQQTEIVLSGFATHIRYATEETFEMLSEGRGEEIDWAITGMSTFHVTDMTSFVTNAVAAQDINIPSPTYHREIAKRVVQGQLPDLDETVKQDIEDEINKNLTDEVIKAAQIGVPQPPPDPLAETKLKLGVADKPPFGKAMPPAAKDK